MVFCMRARTLCSTPKQGLLFLCVCGHKHTQARMHTHTKTHTHKHTHTSTQTHTLDLYSLSYNNANLSIKDICITPQNKFSPMSPPFLDATTHLYERSCPSVGPSVRWSVPCYFRTKKNAVFEVGETLNDQ